jgi:LuxR family transcriptional regulator, maltose regulon positive regulatory protein
MPQDPLALLRFSLQEQGYTLTNGALPLSSEIPLSHQAWQAWLQTVSSFAFENRSGEHYTIRKERLQRGDAYWYAYRSIGGRTKKRYLGRTADLSFERLEELSARFTEQKQQVLTPKGGRATCRSAPVLAPFLETKLHPPRLSAQLVERVRLLTDLDAVFSHGMVLLCAAAGSGKTTLLCAWTSHARACAQSVAWLSLDEIENDPVRFWTSVIAALQHDDPDQSELGERALALLQAQAPQTVWPAVLTTLINELTEWGKEMVLILDDYHVITEQSIHASLLFLVEHLPSHLHLVLSSRTEPDFPLSQLRGRGQMVEIRDPDLRFSHEEAREFLTEKMHLPLSDADVALLEVRTENWIVGLHLAALALSKHEDLGSLVKDFAGSQQYLLDYFQQEILERQEASIQHFLLQTAVLTNMNAAVCQAVTGASSLQASQQMLETVERAHLFVVPLDEERRWYRFHALFREVLLARLHVAQPEQVPLLHLRAARWYEAQGRLEEAIAHALEARDGAYTADLLERFVAPDNWGNEYHTLRRFLARLPSDVFAARPDLSILYAYAIVLTSQRGPRTLDLVEEPLQWAEQGYRETSKQTGLGSVWTVRAVLIAHRGDFAHSFALARQALDLLPEQDRMWRGHCLSLLGTEALCSGQLAQASQLLRQGLALYEISGSLPGMQVATAMLGEVALNQGDLHTTAQTFRRVLALSNEQQALHQSQLTLGTGMPEDHYEHIAHYGLAQLAYDWNRLGEAEQLLQEALSGGYLVWSHLLIPGLLLQVRLLSARGQFQQAQDFLSERAAHNQRPEVLREIAFCQAWLALGRGDLAHTEHWASSLPQAVPLPLSRREEEVLLLARLRIAQGQPEVALDLLEGLKREAFIETRKRSALQILLLETAALEASGARARAKEALLQACRQARLEGYQRLFLDEGPALETLLKALVRDRQEGALATYLRTLLQAFASGRGNASTSRSQETAWLAEPLTPQEQRVLRLLAEGATNQEIADQLIISLATAKKHVANILLKLGAQNRTQAGALAREYGLL